MSVTSDIALLLRKQEYKELKEIINSNKYMDTFEKEMFNRGHIADVQNSNFIVVYWAYIKWDEATNEMVEIVNQYIDNLKHNNIPFRYIQISEFEVSDQQCYGSDPNNISIITSVMYPHTSIKFSTQINNFREGL